MMGLNQEEQKSPKVKVYCLFYFYFRFVDFIIDKGEVRPAQIVLRDFEIV